MKSFHHFRGWLASQRLPVRIPVPCRDDMIAIGLMALAFGLMVGVALGPALGAASNAVAGLAPSATTAPAVEETETADTGTTSTDEVALGAPSGSVTTDSTTVSDSSASPDTSIASTDTGTDYVDTSGTTDDTTDNIEPAPADTTPDPDPVPVEKGSELVGIVVGTQPDGGDYDVADSSGNVLSLHATEPPAVGKKVKTRIETLSNGTFGELGDRTLEGRKPKAKLRGVVSWVSQDSKLMVVSSRGSSLAVDFSAIPEEQSTRLVPGTWVESTVLFTDPVEAVEGAEGTELVPPVEAVEARPGLVAESMEADEEPSDRIELSGAVEAVDSDLRILTVTSDSNGIISMPTELKAPKKLDLESIVEKRAYNFTADIGADGTFTITGMSPDYSRATADDPEAAFGDHG